MAIDVALARIVTDCKLEQWENAMLPVDVTLVGIVIDCKSKQFKNTELPNNVTYVGILYVENWCFDGKWIMVAKSLVNRIPSFETKCKFFDSTIIDCKSEQSENAESPIDVTLCGIVIDCKLR